MKNSRPRKSARGQICEINWAGVCNYDPTTTVMAHIGFKGEATNKRGYEYDENGIHACFSCHDVIDNRVDPPSHHRYSQMERAELIRELERLERERDLYFYCCRGLVRMRRKDRALMAEHGLIKV